ncbi:MAG TPA: hypothetical protein ENK99_01280 [Campylobacterales bacterium]|nr:hypothetical protein [Campylobacterales bacterium]
MTKNLKSNLSNKKRIRLLQDMPIIKIKNKEINKKIQTYLEPKKEIEAIKKFNKFILITSNYLEGFDNE